VFSSKSENARLLWTGSCSVNCLCLPGSTTAVRYLTHDAFVLPTFPLRTSRFFQLCSSLSILPRFIDLSFSPSLVWRDGAASEIFYLPSYTSNRSPTPSVHEIPQFMIGYCPVNMRSEDPVHPQPALPPPLHQFIKRLSHCVREFPVVVPFCGT
jgi:hypothetical protein